MFFNSTSFTCLAYKNLTYRRAGKHLLIAIDEVTSTEYMRVFAASFQVFLRQNLPVFLLMTGLYENINELQNEITRNAARAHERRLAHQSS